MSTIWHPPEEKSVYLLSGTGEIACVQYTEVLARGRSEFQDYAILDTVAFGPVLVLDDVIQSAAYDEWIYHETFVQPPMCVHECPRRVAVLGGGEGAMLREILRHPTVESVVMVDIDQKVVELCVEHLPSFHEGAFDDSRVTVLHDDARGWLERLERPDFDVVLIDVTEPLQGGPAVQLFTREFYETVKASLAPGGVVALQAGSLRPGLSWGYSVVIRTLESVFPSVRTLSCWVTSFSESWGFAIAGGAELDGLDGQTIDRVLEGRKITPRHLDGAAFDAQSCLPLYVRRELEQTDTVATDEHPIEFLRT